MTANDIADLLLEAADLVRQWQVVPTRVDVGWDARVQVHLHRDDMDRLFPDGEEWRPMEGHERRVRTVTPRADVEVFALYPIPAPVAVEASP